MTPITLPRITLALLLSLSACAGGTIDTLNPTSDPSATDANRAPPDKSDSPGKPTSSPTGNTPNDAGSGSPADKPAAPSNVSPNDPN